MKLIQSLLSVLVAFSGAHASAATTPLETADNFFGIQIGVALETQFGACPIEADRPARLEDKHCWTKDRYGGRTVLYSKKMFAEVGLLEIRQIRELGGVVVEVEAEFFPADAKKVERYLRQHKGPPSESEPFERDSRLFGLKSYMAHTWRSAGATIHFLEMGSGGKGVVRGFSDRWAKEEKARQDALNQPRK